MEVGADRRTAVGALVLCGYSWVLTGTPVGTPVDESGRPPTQQCVSVATARTYTLQHTATEDALHMQLLCVQVVFDLQTLFRLSGVVTQARIAAALVQPLSASDGTITRTFLAISRARTQRSAAVHTCRATLCWASGNGLSRDGLNGNGTKWERR